MGYNSVDIKWLATELEGISCERLGDEKLAELIAAFRGIVGGPEKPSLSGLESLPRWFLVKTIERVWPDIRRKDLFIFQLHSQFEKNNYRDFKIQIAATVSIVDPSSGLLILERMDDKKLRKKGILPKCYIDSILKYFAGEDSRPITAIFRYRFPNNRVLKIVALQLFEVFFVGKATFPLASKCTLQSQLLHWLIIHNQYLACVDAFPNAISNEILMWPMSMVAEYEAIRTAADTARVPFGTLRDLFPKSIPIEEEINPDKQILFQKVIDTELLEEIGKRLSAYKCQIELNTTKINEQSQNISKLQAQKDSFYQKLSSLENENKKLIAQRKSKELYTQELSIFEEKIAKLIEQLEAKDRTIAALDRTICAAKSDCTAQIDKMAKRIAIESEHSKRELTEKVHDLLFQEFNDMNQLGDSEGHKVAKIMLGHVFSKLGRLGITFND